MHTLQHACVIRMQISVALYTFISVCVWGKGWVTLAVSRHVLLVLVQWARPCIRQVELQGEFCNTWPVSLSHLCGWRREGRKSWEGRAAQVVRGDWRHEWQWKVIARERENNSWGSRREENWDDGAFRFPPSFSPSHYSFGLLQSLTHFLLLTPFKFKGQKSKCTGSG